MKTPKNRGCGNIPPPILKKIEIKGKLHILHIFNILYLISTYSGGLLVFFDDELTTFKNKNNRAGPISLLSLYLRCW